MMPIFLTKKKHAFHESTLPICVIPLGASYFLYFFLFLGIDIHSLLHGTTTVVTCGSAVLTTCTIPL